MIFTVTDFGNLNSNEIFCPVGYGQLHNDIGKAYTKLYNGAVAYKFMAVLIS